MDIKLENFTHLENYVSGTIKDYDFSAKHYDLPSKCGINGGRTSKLSISKDDKMYVNYDRGWDIIPNNEEIIQITEEIIEFLEELPIRFEDQLSL